MACGSWTADRVSTWCMTRVYCAILGTTLTHGAPPTEVWYCKTHKSSNVGPNNKPTTIAELVG
ncbi:hypothetical protein PF007_g19127 [Phytophthora fragariae]|uniref:Uncharacterized protein n=1 Tax=Phytophthora fragariae TaxID=53985 RepID=A0A6A4BGG4_9STRA|nr:hypothetical protein PF009_g21109 [Phytophthora fragariae]KAE8968094.1 hypothetical protein PF011_g27311 [Phytophthora fragariae]KAE9090742.1 hypothetical protein PF007_g19127 [Phytophthora fragariae]KAE9177712.1 hypothetical protein PF004_g25698 [Phytophthora fragariae]KAE9272529.1 hypothetical protein PF001_g27901 [Phytophthora fragariae]